MTTVTGEAAVMLGVLGRRKGDDRILDVVALVGPDMEVDEFASDDGGRTTYFAFPPTGTDLIFKNDLLVSVMVRTQPDLQDESYGLYPRPAALIEGLSGTAGRAEVKAFMGAPERVGPNFDVYEVNERYLHFEFDSNDRAARITGLLDLIPG